MGYNNPIIKFFFIPDRCRNYLFIHRNRMTQSHLNRSHEGHH